MKRRGVQSNKQQDRGQLGLTAIAVQRGPQVPRQFIAASPGMARIWMAMVMASLVSHIVADLISSSAYVIRSENMELDLSFPRSMGLVQERAIIL